MPESVFVQPHFDDVALSCGGTVVSSEQPKLVTVFAGAPDGSLSEFAQFQHSRWSATLSDAVQMRRKEDDCAAHHLGASVVDCRLGYLDAIYRHEAYASDEALFGNPVPDDDQMILLIANDLSKLGQRFYVPMAVGNHVDHQLVFNAGQQLANAGKEVWCYADLPYALDAVALQHRIDVIGDGGRCVRALSGREFERRWQAIECYESQLPVIFRTLVDPRSRFEQFGRRPEDTGPVEYFWRLPRSEGRP